MTKLAARIIAFLRLATAELSVGQISHGLKEPGQAIHLELTPLIRSGAVNRHHHADGILRYTIGDAAPEPKVNPERAVAPRKQMHPRPSPKSDMVMFALKSNGSLTKEGIRVAINGALSLDQISNLLQMLRRKGFVDGPEPGTNGAWSLTHAAPAVTKPQLPEVTESGTAAIEEAEPAAVPKDPPVAVPVATTADPLRPAGVPQNERLVQLAQLATASAVEVFASDPVRSQALVKIAAANALLVEAHFIVRQEHAT